MKYVKLWKALFMPSIFGVDDAIIAGVASAAVGAAASTYSANQANRVAESRDYNGSYINIISQLQNQDYNAQQAGMVRDFNSREAGIARDYNASQAQMNRDFQAQQSGSSYQRAVADMKAAGLNPMLAYSQGGASTPNGTAANIGMASGPGASSANAGPSKVGQTFMPNIQTPSPQSALDAMSFKTRMENTEAQTDYMKSQTDKTDKEARNLDDVQENLKMDIAKKIEEVKLVVAQERGTNAQAYATQMLGNLTDIKRDTEKIDQDLKLGEITLNKARERYQNIGARLDELQEKGAENQDAINRTKWGEKGRPILDDIGKVTGAASGVAGILRSRGR